MPELFHVHTYRCCHASFDSDRAYIERAIELGASRITFTDHAPFPGDPFTNRMPHSQLDEYVASLRTLKIAYRSLIDVRIGLEIEYLPSFLAYYEKLANDPFIDILLLGQHFYELSPGKYSFSLDDETCEHVGLCEAMAQGIETGLFAAVAHPDRAFRDQKSWSDAMTELSTRVIDAAVSNEVALEQNYRSMKRRRSYWPEFWELVPECAPVIHGCDAHSVAELSFRMPEPRDAEPLRCKEDIEAGRGTVLELIAVAYTSSLMQVSR